MLKNFMEIPPQFFDVVGKPCSSKCVGEYRSLSVGFGLMVPSQRINRPDTLRSEWELGTYTSAWRIIRDEAILCGSMNPVEDNAELEREIQSIDIDTVASIQMTSRFDLRAVMTSGLILEFLCVSNDDDEIFHARGPSDFFASYSWANGWRVGKSSKPIG